MVKPFAPPLLAPRTPETRLPAGVCDTYVHLMGGPEDFPPWEGRVEPPAKGISFSKWLKMYNEHIDIIYLSRDTVVHSIFYGTDNTVPLASLEALGRKLRAVSLMDQIGRLTSADERQTIFTDTPNALFFA